MTISITALTAKGARANNQDALLLGNHVITAGEHPFLMTGCIVQSDPRISVFAVADGAGGNEAGEVASEAALRLLAAESFADINDFREKVDECFERMQTAVEEALGSRWGGSTISVLAMGEGQYVCANLGDSPVYKANSGRLNLISEIHTEAEEKLMAGVRKKDITEQERHSLTRCLGSAGYDIPSFSSGVFAQGDVFVLCSDGFAERFPKNRLLRELHRPSPKLFSPNTYAATDDNCSAIIIFTGKA
ncbi:MAG: serine/threonine-protein phosphatase [Ruminococcaceae bacterium]|nr:serine/threonine-protein phosphatase [Oscillospiraceae bacterium]